MNHAIKPALYEFLVYIFLIYLQNKKIELNLFFFVLNKC